MGLASTFAGVIRRRAADPAKVYAETSSFVGFLNAPTSPAPDATALVETETINPALARCIDCIADDAASVPLQLFDITGEQPSLIDDHPAIDLFRSVNPVDTPTILFRTLYADIISEGNFFGFLELDRGVPMKILRLQPEQVDVVPDKTTIIGGYKWKRPGMTQAEFYTPMQMMHVRTRNPESPYRGLGKLVRLRDQILLERAARQWKLQTFLNGIPQGVVIRIKRQAGTESEWQRFQEQFWEKLKGPKNAGKPIFLKDAEAEVTILPRPTEDEIGFQSLLTHIRNEYAMLMGVPPSRLSDYSESFRSAASEQGRTYWQDTIMSWHRLVLDYLNSTFLPRWFPDARVRGKPAIAFAYDYSKVRALALSQRDQAQLNEILVRNGMRTPNEAAVSMGDPSHEDPAADDLYMNGKPLGEVTDPAAQPGDPAAMPGGDMGPNGQDGEDAVDGEPSGSRLAPTNGKEAARV